MFKILIKNNISKLVLIAILTFIYSGFGIGVISFINENILTIKEFDAFVAIKFLLLLLLFFVSSVCANIALTTFGHNLVYTMRKELVKRILDTPTRQIELIGVAKIIASLNNDIRTISFAFMSAPGLIQGLILIFCVGWYLFYISPKLFLFVFVWMGLTIFAGVFFMAKIHHFFKLARKSDDGLQASFNDVTQGHKELSLNRGRAAISFDEFDRVALDKKSNLIKADIYNSLSENFSNIMLLGLVGMCIFLSISFGWASMQTAVTTGLTILFLRTSIMSMINSVPSFLSAKVSFDKIKALSFVEFKDEKFIQNNLNKAWKSIKFKDVSFEYGSGFGLKSLNLDINRSELIFLIGKNGSGKSTFSNLLCGLLRPCSGGVYFDDVLIDDENLRDFQSHISAIFSDFYLFSQVIDESANFIDEEIAKGYLNMLEIASKVQIKDGRLSTISLSSGQKKRLSMLLVLCENRDIIVLDEWAAEQDPVFKRVFYREVLPYLKSLGKTIIAISHDDSYFDIADRILLAKDGFITELKGDERDSASRDAVEKIS